MDQITERRLPASSPPDIQDAFLNHVRRNGAAVTIRLMDGRMVEARIRGFDKFAVLVEAEGMEQLVFKHAIAAIEPSQAVADEYAARRS